MPHKNKSISYFETVEITSINDIKLRLHETESKYGLIGKLFSLHSHIEQMLKFWIILTNGSNKETNKESFNIVKKYNYKQLVEIHLLNGNLNKKQFGHLLATNAFRNNIAHQFSEINFNSDKTQKTLHEKITKGLTILEELHFNYLKELEKRS